MSRYDDYMELKRQYFEYLSLGVMTPEIKQLYWRDLKYLERSSRCHMENGTRCTANCRNCPRQREGTPLSLDALAETGIETTDVFSLGSQRMKVADMFSLESQFMELELSEILIDAISTLDEPNQTIIILFSKGATERTIAAEVGMSQKGVNNRIHKIIAMLQEELKDFF